MAPSAQIRGGNGSGDKRKEEDEILYSYSHGMPARASRHILCHLILCHVCHLWPNSRNPCAARDKLEEDVERSKTRKEEMRLVINKNSGGDSKKITRFGFRGSTR